MLYYISNLVAIKRENRGRKEKSQSSVVTKHCSPFALNNMASSKGAYIAVAIKKMSYCPAIRPHIALLLTNQITIIMTSSHDNKEKHPENKT
jgi:hypothetical protein